MMALLIFFKNSTFLGNSALITTPNQLLTLAYQYPRWVAEPSVYKYPACLPRVHMTAGGGQVPCRAVAWSRFRPVRVLHDGRVLGLTPQDEGSPPPPANDIAYAPDAGALLVGRDVVARSALDGYYYKGKVLSQVSITKSAWV